jgi:hypothetical protein
MQKVQTVLEFWFNGKAVLLSAGMHTGKVVKSHTLTKTEHDSTGEHGFRKQVLSMGGRTKESTKLYERSKKK